MKCIHMNKYNAVFVLVSVVVNNIHQTEMADNPSANAVDTFSAKDQLLKNITNDAEPLTPKIAGDSVLHCDSNEECINLKPPCIDCEYNTSCIYGDSMNVSCRANPIVKCKGHRQFQHSLICRYCYQTEIWEQNCDLKANCDSTTTPKVYYRTNCTVRDDILCLGRRTFFRNLKCNWTSGYRWSTALILSVTLGGFGADRFYLGHWQEGIGKLFSFGGLGVWTLVDVILISLHYLGPADGSLYI